MPICKNGNKEEPLGYRPMALISIVWKICEKVIKKQWIDYLEREGIIWDRQFGFRTGRSCHQFIKLLSKSDGYNTRTWWMGGFHIFRFKKNIW